MRPAVATGSPGNAPGNVPDEPLGRRPLSDWLRERLFERRIVQVTGRLGDVAAAETAAALIALDAGGDEPIDLYLDSGDGTLEAAFVVIDAIDLLHAPLHVHCRGQVGGAAIGVVVAATHRSAAPHTRFRLFEPVSVFSGTPGEIARRSAQQQRLLWSLCARLAQRTGRPTAEIAQDLRRSRFLDAQEALDYGLIDEVRAAR